MNNVDPKTVDEIFRQALELAEDERSSFIADRCRDNEPLKNRVTQLLNAAVSDVDPLAGIVNESRAHLFESLAEDTKDGGEDLSGSKIGRWRIEKSLARGGLATVYVAHRDDGQYEKRVALKVLRRGLDTDDVIARFRAERQILSTVEHPAIAQMLDGGTLDDGRPYLVLEYVDGTSITEFCRTNNIDVRARVRLIITVLQALHQAHQHLIVHRDIKPSNIMVSTEGRVMLLDFGIAKLLDPGAIPGGSSLTRTGVVLLTPEYGSPEQHTGQAVTTASDIYQVGGVLYELLVGRRAPSGALASPHTVTDLPSRAAKGTGRRAEIKGDLDAIVSKAMHADPAKRYGSATDMVADLERYLAGRPVSAKPDTLTYRFSRLIRRRPLLLPAVIIAIATTTGYIVTLNNHNREIRVEQERAASAQAFMIDLLGSANPYGPSDRDRGKDILVVDALDIGLERLRTDAYGGDDKLRAALLSSIAEVYGDLDKHQAAIQTHFEALALEKDIYGSVSEAVLLSSRELAHQYRTVGDYDKAGEFYAEQLSVAQELYSSNDPKLALAEAASGLYEFRLANTERATVLMESAVTTLREYPDDYAIDLIDATVTLARIRKGTSLDHTLAMLLEARDFADKKFGPRSPMAGLTRTQYATSVTLSGDFAAAEKNFDEAIDIYESRLGRDHGATLIALLNLGRLYFAKGEFANAEVVQKEVYGHYVRKYGLHQAGVAESAQELGLALSAQGRYDEAILFHRQAYESYLTVLGDKHVRLYRPLLSLARAQIEAGLTAEAQANAALVVENMNRIQPDSALLPEAQRLLETLADATNTQLP